MTSVHARASLFVRAVKLALALLLVSASGCEGTVELPFDPRVTVMVIDDGFDVSLPVFEGKVAATYTVTCPREQGSSDLAAAMTPVQDDAAATEFTSRKAALLAQLAESDDGCRLVAGLPPPGTPLADLEPDRAAWNAAIAAGTFGEAPPIVPDIFIRLLAGSFHGTATAGLIAHENPRVQLVLVQRRTDEARQDTTPSCPRQDQLDESVRLLADPDVRSAYLARPRAELDRQLDEVKLRHHVGIVNESYGRLPRAVLEDAWSARGCPAVSLRPYMALLTDLEQAFTAAHPGAPVLTLKAAGNDGLSLDDAEDSEECQRSDGTRLLVGSYGAREERSPFSNYGACVDVFAPGEDVVVNLPGGWLFPFLSGTSFAAPLLTRLVTLSAPLPFDPGRASAALLGERDTRRFIPLARFPRALLWDLNAAPSLP